MCKRSGSSVIQFGRIELLVDESIIPTGEVGRQFTWPDQIDISTEKPYIIPDIETTYKYRTKYILNINRYF